MKTDPELGGMNLGVTNGMKKVLQKFQETNMGWHELWRDKWHENGMKRV